MGGNESKKEDHVKVENNTYVVNKTDIEMLNRTNQSVSNNAMVKIIQQNTTQTVATNSLTIDNVELEIDGNLNIDMTNNVSVKITTEFINKVVTQIQTDLAASMTSAIENNVSNEILSKLMNHLDEKTKNGWGDISDKLGIMDKSSESKSTEIINKINTSNELYTKLENVINLVVNSSINTEISNQCINTAINKNNATIQNSKLKVHGNFSLNQLNTLELVSSCTANNEVISEITDKLAQVFDVKIKDDKQNKSSSDTSSDITKETENQGIGGAIGEGAEGVGKGAGEILEKTGDALSKTIDSAGGAVSGIFSGMTWIFIVIGIVIVVAIIGIVIFLNSGAGQEISKSVAAKGLGINANSGQNTGNGQNANSGQNTGNGQNISDIMSMAAIAAKEINGGICSRTNYCNSDNTFLKRLING